MRSACPTIERPYTINRLDALRPGERFVYLSLIAGSKDGPCFQELVGCILDHAAGLALVGRIERQTLKRCEQDDRNRPIRITDYIAIGRRPE